MPIGGIDDFREGHLALSFLNVVAATFGEWRRPTG
jgi:hypothetical protein